MCRYRSQPGCLTGAKCVHVYVDLLCGFGCEGGVESAAAMLDRYTHVHMHTNVFL